MGSKFNPVYAFSKDKNDWQETDLKKSKTILGGKGAALVSMVASGFNVPPGFTITTQVCNAYLAADDSDKDGFIKILREQVVEHLMGLWNNFGFMPLVSVRSGAPVSMPGMMDTILNVGLTSDNISEWEARIGLRAAWDSYRRLIQMLGSTAYGVPHSVFEAQLDAIKKSEGVTQDTDLSAEALQALVIRYLYAFQEATGQSFPQTPIDQAMSAVTAVFRSWGNPRAIEYRKLNNIPASMGTACTVQAMVFGNMGEDSGTGVLFTRNPSTGDADIMGEFLQNAQGEDVVAGIRTPVSIHKMPTLGGQWLSIYEELESVCDKLEDMYADMVDIEFTVQMGELFILQSRVGKRSAQAAFVIADDLVSEGVISWSEASKRLTRNQFKIVKRPSIDPAFKTPSKFVGLPACPGVVTGVPVFSAADAVKTAADGLKCILVSHETTPDDIAGMNAAVGILTQTGGATSHAAVVARAMDKACVVGCTDLNFEMLKKTEVLTIDGSTGRVWLDTDVPVIDGSSSDALQRFEAWATKDCLVGQTVPQSGFPATQVIHASHWWGSREVASTVIEYLESLPSCQNIVIDLRSPLELVQPVDSVLSECFGGSTAVADASFAAWLSDQLHKKATQLEGLTIGGANALNATPAEYLMFCRLSCN